MSIESAGYTFEGPFKMPYESDLSLGNQSGVYIIYGNNGGNTWYVVDVGESEDVRTRVANHDRESCWLAQGYSTLGVAVHYASAGHRMIIESIIRQNSNPPCGVR